MEPQQTSSDGILDDFDVPWNEKRRKDSKIYCGKYLKGDVLGKGTFATVLEVLDIKTLERRAVKRFDLQHIQKIPNGGEIVGMIQTEARILRTFSHKNLIKIVDVFFDSQNQQSLATLSGRHSAKLYLCMEYCASNVDELLKAAPGNKFGTQQSCTYLLSLVDGLEYLHSYGVVHKDVKPQNMLITTSGDVKITDLGVCELLDRYNCKDAVSSTFGSKLYQAPELYLSQENLRFSGYAVDIWATGVTLYQMMTGTLPFFSHNDLHLMKAVTKEPFRMADELSTDAALHDLIDKFLTKEPNDRITLDAIRRHPWCSNACWNDTSDSWAKIPPKEDGGDKYRSMTLTPSLHQLHFPLRVEENTVKMTEETATALTRIINTPIIKGNRSPKPGKKRHQSYVNSQLDSYKRSN